MILLENKGARYTIDSNYSVKPNDIVLNDIVKNILQQYNSPAQGFKTSFLANMLEQKGFNVLDVYDEELENSPDGLVY